jgi:hypothetical protein
MLQGAVSSLLFAERVVVGVLKTALESTGQPPTHMLKGNAVGEGVCGQIQSRRDITM